MDVLGHVRPKSHDLSGDGELAKRALGLQRLGVEDVVPSRFHPITLLRTDALRQGHQQAGVVVARPGLDPCARHCKACSLGEGKCQRLAVILVQSNVLVVELEHVSAPEVRVIGKEPPISPAICALLGTHLRAFVWQALHDDPEPVQLGSLRELSCGVHDEKTIATLREGSHIVIEADFVVHVAIARVTDQVAPCRRCGLAEDSPIGKFLIVGHDVVQEGLALTPEVCQGQGHNSSNLGKLSSFGVDRDIKVLLACVLAYPSHVFLIMCQHNLGPERLSINCPRADRPQR
mmetsp:Transcript_88778/g.240142  ORF Transcript_88778/g.240142 Transcript_88778/m.240142 type:complete len:290 (-) Transcript_88778:182-1051(-)